ncbi:hypothetical protein Raf01_25320 [Rugosimonospora africana]|uniref:Toprim domain-containing protein n=2 Tax=Rugosimonospora africana TaxID=556532 RepID=A0A8J3QRL0_9ACTN|nr:hypothetical protein Raf01_25320 [Rugosimonospora africana]
MAGGYDSNGPGPARRLLAAHRAATDFYRGHLLDEPRATAYLDSRGIAPAVAVARPWTVGYAPRGWTGLRDHLRGIGFTDAELLAAGLITTGPRRGPIDAFRDRVVFPIRDSDGYVVAFIGRDLSGRPGTPKYRNTATTPIYRKSELLYGLAEQFGGGRRPDALLIVEGPADVVAVAGLSATGSVDAHRDPADRYCAVAPCGTALTAAQVALLASAVEPGTPVVCAFDADVAGAAATEQAYRLLRDWPGPVEAVVLPDGADPASVVAGGPAGALATLRRARVPLADLILDRRLAPHLARLEARLTELARLGRDPSSESRQLGVDAVHALAALLAEVADAEPLHAAQLLARMSVRLDLNPLTVFEAVYPPSP